MTLTRDEEIIADALAVIDKALHDLGRRQLVSSTEVADLLLDMRSVLTAPQPSPTPS